MAKAPDLPQARLGPPGPLAPAIDALAIYILSVGDGDAIVLQFPQVAGERSYAVIDSNNGVKTLNLLQDVLQAGRLRFVCATHPHLDHIRGLEQILRTVPTDEFWDSGFLYTSKTYNSIINEVERQPTIRLIRPTSGFQAFVNGVRITVLSPSIMLRNRYDTYGVDPNNASIVLRLEYPRPPPSRDFPPTADSVPPAPTPSRSVILGGDAQTDAWSRVLEEFPHLTKDESNWARQISVRQGRQPLSCDVLKVSHHCSKHGVNLELVERMGDVSGSGPSKGPRYIVSSCADPSQHGFPHLVAQEIIREVRDPKASAGGIHPADDQLGIHYTCQMINGASPAGSLAVVLHGDASMPSLYRLCDPVNAMVSLNQARRVL